MQLPTGLAAATARKDKVRVQARHIADLLSQLGDDPTGAARLARAALNAVEADPLSSSSWSQLGVLTHGARTVAARTVAANTGDGGNFAAWDRIHQAVQNGEYARAQMAKIETANAPICDAHGPMTPTDTTDGWACANAPGCTAPYLRIDGTHLRRAPKHGR